MEPVKYYFESYNNRELPEEEQGYANITLISAASQSLITDHLIGQQMSQQKMKVKVDFSAKSLEVNKKHCPKIFNIKDPLTDKLYPELSIEQLYKAGQFKELYEELTNVVGDVNRLKDGLKKK